MLEIVCFRFEAYKEIGVEERMSLGCEMLNAKKTSLKLMYEMEECGAGVNEGKRGPCQGERYWADVAGGQYDWTVNSCLNSKAKGKQTEGGNRDGLPKMETLPLCVGMNI